MIHGSTAAETAALNGWDVGTLVRGYEEWSDGVGVWSTWRITAIGEDCVLVKTVRCDYTDREPVEHEGPEHTVTFRYRDWHEVDHPAAPVPPTNTTTTEDQ